MPKRQQPCVSAYYWKEKRNFGDLLSPLLLEHFAQCQVFHADPVIANVVSTGSVLDLLPIQGWDGIVAGSGKLLEETALDLTKARVFGLRGPLTLDAMKLTRMDRMNMVLGDPGLLAPEMVNVERDKYPLGCIPHVSDTELYIRELVRSQRDHYVEPMLIDPTGDPQDVLRLIGSCTKVISSSLHGLIVADAFGIPRRAERFAGMEANRHEGGDFKFRDYSESIGMPIEFGTLQEAPHVKIEQMQYDLFDMFQGVAGLIYAM